MGAEQAKPRSYRFDDDVIAAIEELPGKTANDKLRGLLIEKPPATVADYSNVLAEILEHVQTTATLPDAEQIETIVEAVMDRKIEERAAARTGPGFNPAAISGVQQGAAGLPRRESWDERTAREKREKEDRIRARSSIGDDPSFCPDPEYVQE